MLALKYNNKVKHDKWFAKKRRINKKYLVVGALFFAAVGVACGTAGGASGVVSAKKVGTNLHSLADGASVNLTNNLADYISVADVLAQAKVADAATGVNSVTMTEAENSYGAYFWRNFQDADFVSNDLLAFAETLMLDLNGDSSLIGFPTAYQNLKDLDGWLTNTATTSYFSVFSLKTLSWNYGRGTGALDFSFSYTQRIFSVDWSTKTRRLSGVLTGSLGFSGAKLVPELFHDNANGVEIGGFLCDIGTGLWNLGPTSGGDLNFPGATINLNGGQWNFGADWNFNFVSTFELGKIYKIK